MGLVGIVVVVVESVGIVVVVVESVGIEAVEVVAVFSCYCRPFKIIS